MRLPGFATRNFRLKLLATVLALFTWAGVVYAANPPGIRTVAVPVPQDSGSLPSGFVLLHRIPDLPVRIAGTQDHLNAFNPASLVVRVHYETITQPGTQQLNVDVRCSDPNVDLDSPPTSLAADIDRLATAKVDVQVVTNPGPPPGYVTGTIQATPGQVTVTGPQHEVSTLVVRTRDINLSNQKSNFEQQVAIFPYDPAGTRLDDVNTSSQSVTVLITIAAVGTQRTTAVVPPIKGAVAFGYRVAGISVSPLTVILSGSQDILNTLNSVGTDVVDLTGLVDDKIFKVNIALPAGVSAVPSQVTVTIFVVSLPTPPPTPIPTPTPGHTP